MPIRRIVATLCLSLVVGQTSAMAEEMWQAGLAKAVITPERDVWLAGYGSKRSPDGKLHELWMKALALEAPDGRRAVLITSDFQGIPKSMSDIAFTRLLEIYGLERHQVMLTFSHNHCGPRLGDDLIDYYPVEASQEELVAEYTAAMIDRLVAMVGEALDDVIDALTADDQAARLAALDEEQAA